MRLPSVVVVSAVLAAGASSALAGDFLQRKDGTWQPALKSGGAKPEASDFDASNLQVLDATFEEILCQLAIPNKPPATQRIPAAGIADIQLEPKDEPSQWKDAIDAVASGDHKRSMAMFKSIATDKAKHPVFRQRAYLNLARAVAASGKTADADRAYDDLLREYEKSFYTLSVWKDRSQMWMDAGDMEKAKAAAQKILDMAGASDGDKLEARFLLVTIGFRVATSANPKDTAGIQKAQGEYKAIASETAQKKELASVNSLARIGQANCLFELGNAAEAKTIYADICERAPGTENAVLAAAFNGQGECLFGEQKYADARRCFLRTVTIYSDGAPADQVAKALYYAGECFARVLDTDDARGRAARELKECINRFPNSPWCEKARRALQGLK